MDDQTREAINRARRAQREINALGAGKPITLELTPQEAEWLDAVLGLVMHLARKWDNRTANDDVANRVWAKLSLARAVGDIGVDPEEWLKGKAP